MRVPDEEAERRLALVDLMLDIEGPVLICEYALAPAGSQVITHLSLLQPWRLQPCLT
jgi:hypothetical protein